MPGSRHAAIRKKKGGSSSAKISCLNSQLSTTLLLVIKWSPGRIDAQLSSFLSTFLGLLPLIGCCQLMGHRYRLGSYFTLFG